MRAAHIALFCKEVQRDGLAPPNFIGIYDHLYSPVEGIQVVDTTMVLRVMPDSNDRSSLNPRTGSLVLKEYYLGLERDKEILVQSFNPTTVNLTTDPSPFWTGHEMGLKIDIINLPHYGLYRFDVILDGTQIASVPMALRPATEESAKLPAVALSRVIDKVHPRLKQK